MCTYVEKEKFKFTNETDVGHEATVVVNVGAAGGGVRRHLAVHVEISKPRPRAAPQKHMSTSCPTH